MIIVHDASQDTSDSQARLVYDYGREKILASANPLINDFVNMCVHIPSISS